MSEMGQKRRFDGVRAESAFPPLATFEPTSRDVSNVPIGVIEIDTLRLLRARDLSLPRPATVDFKHQRPTQERAYQN
jgi:hypothetical protein